MPWLWPLSASKEWLGQRATLHAPRYGVPGGQASASRSTIQALLHACCCMLAAARLLLLCICSAASWTCCACLSSCAYGLLVQLAVEWACVCVDGASGRQGSRFTRLHISYSIQYSILLFNNQPISHSGFSLWWFS